MKSEQPYSGNRALTSVIPHSHIWPTI